jgi:hypothetical protein
MDFDSGFYHDVDNDYNAEDKSKFTQYYVTWTATNNTHTVRFEIVNGTQGADEAIFLDNVMIVAPIT